MTQQRYQVKYEPLALAALEEAAEYIKERNGPGGPGASSSWLQAMLASTSKLEHLPTAFAVWTERAGVLVYAKLALPRLLRC